MCQYNGNYSDMTVVGVSLVTMDLIALSHKFFLDNLLPPTLRDKENAITMTDNMQHPTLSLCKHRRPGAEKIELP